MRHSCYFQYYVEGESILVMGGLKENLVATPGKQILGLPKQLPCKSQLSEYQVMTSRINEIPVTMSIQTDTGNLLTVVT